MENKRWLNIDDLVFENRNKGYGAYLLRKMYGKNMSKGMLAGMLLFLLLIFSPKIYAFLKNLSFAPNEKVEIKTVTLAEPPSLNPNQPPPPPPPKVIPPPPKATIKFVPPKVQKDEEVKDEEPPPKIEEIKENVIATKTQEGEKTEGNAEPVVEVPKEAPKVIEEDPDEKKIFEFVQQQPEFPDGAAALQKYLYANLKYPVIARENQIEGRVVVKFTVTKNGDIQDVQVVRGIGGGCDEEAVRVIKSMPPWKPGKHNGKAVNVKFNLPVTFKLEG